MYFYGRRNKSSVVNVVATSGRVIVRKLLRGCGDGHWKAIPWHLFQQCQYIAPLKFIPFDIALDALDTNYDARN